VSDAADMLREAQYEFQNVSPGAMDSKKHAAKAKSLARRIIRKYPDSYEATAAQSLLANLGERVSVPKPRNRHIHAQGNERHKPHRRVQRDIPRSTASTEQSLADGRLSGFKNQFLMPGWPLRLMQAIPVVVGVILILRGLNVTSYSRVDSSVALLLVAGALLVYFPRLDAFNDLVSYAKTRIFLKEDWDSKSKDLPTRQDIAEIVAAFVEGNKSKRLAMILVILFLSGFLVTFAAAFYVVGARNSLDSIEGWLLNRKSTVPETDKPQ